MPKYINFFSSFSSSKQHWKQVFFLFYFLQSFSPIILIFSKFCNIVLWLFVSSKFLIIYFQSDHNIKLYVFYLQILSNFVEINFYRNFTSIIFKSSKFYIYKFHVNFFQSLLSLTTLQGKSTELSQLNVSNRDENVQLAMFGYDWEKEWWKIDISLKILCNY